jgi:hypothetical protein
LRKCDWAITAFTCQRKRYRFIIALLGLCHILSTFQRLIKALLQKYSCTEFAYNHLDDIIVYSSRLSLHIEYICCVLVAFSSMSLTINQEKSFFFVTRVLLLGMIYELHGICLNTRKLLNMMEWASYYQKEVAEILGHYQFLSQVHSFGQRKASPIFWDQRQCILMD